MSKPPSIRARVPNYNNKWTVQIYDTQQNLIFPSENENLTPMDFVPKLSNVACVLQCGGLWFGGKGWGLTWKVNQVVVKPREVVSVYDKCHISLTTDELAIIDKEPVDEESDSGAVAVKDTVVADSDEEDEPAPAPTPKKKVVKRAAPAAEEPTDEEADVPAPKKKVVRKKAAATA